MKKNEYLYFVKMTHQFIILLCDKCRYHCQLFCFKFGYDWYFGEYSGLNHHKNCNSINFINWALEINHLMTDRQDIHPCQSQITMTGNVLERGKHDC